MALFDGLAARVERRARNIVEQTMHLAEAALAEVPGIMLHREGDRLIISGSGLMRRWLGDGRLRFAPWSRR